MRLKNYIREIEVHLIETHSRLLDWFKIDDEVKRYRPSDGGWDILEILEHVALTSHFLLILIDKGTEKALKNIKNLSLDEVEKEFEYDLRKIERVGIHKSFEWVRPEHMEPKKEKSEEGIKEELIDQMRRCLNQLKRLEKGEGLLYKTTMSVDNLGKINVYEYIYFLSKHGERHLQQIEENKREFEKIKEEASHQSSGKG